MMRVKVSEKDREGESNNHLHKTGRSERKKVTSAGLKK